MTSSDVYEKICKHLAKTNDIRDIVVSGDDHDQSDRAPGYQRTKGQRFMK